MVSQKVASAVGGGGLASGSVSLFPLALMSPVAWRAAHRHDALVSVEKKCSEIDRQMCSLMETYVYTVQLGNIHKCSLI